MTIFLTAPSLISGFQFLADKKPTTAVVSDIFAADLNGDGVQEAIFVGRQTQPATISTWSNSTIHIFQVNASGAWGETTNSLLPDNVIQGSEPNVLVGDFNNDGKVDFFVPSDTDMNYLVPSYLFLNTGSNFTKHAFDFQTWAHGAYVADVNQDGYLDVLSTDYGPRAGIGFGGPSGFTYKSNDLREGFGFTSSGISAADFMGDGSVTILVSDNVGYPSETGLFSWNINSQAKLTFHLISTLPMPRFELPKWDYMNFNPGDGSIPKMYLDDSHDVRVVPFNFSGDALIDAIVMSRPAYTNGTWPEYSEIQFLLNKGNGVFEDVTDSKLIGYNNASPTSYQPIFLDVNGDGRTDIFISSSDFSNYNSTAVLLQQANGTFLETGRDAFSNLYKSAVANVKSANLGYVFTDWGQPMQLAKGVDGKITVLGSVCYQNAQGGMSNMVFSSDLSFGNISFDETITGSVGNDTLNGGAGIDTAVYAGNRSNYTLTKNPSNFTISSFVEGTDILTNVENLTFTDVTLPTSIDLFFATKGTAVAARGAVDVASAIATQMSVVYLGRPADKTLLLDLKTALDNGQPLEAVLSLISAKAIQDGAFSANDSSKNIVVNTFNNIMGFLPSAYEQTEWAKYIDNGTLTKANAPWIIFQSYLGANNVPDVYKLPTQARFVAAQTFSDYAFLDTNQAGLASLNSIYANAARKWLAPVDSVSHAASKMQTMIADIESVTLTGVAPVDTFVG